MYDFSFVPFHSTPAIRASGLDAAVGSALWKVRRRGGRSFGSGPVCAFLSGWGKLQQLKLNGPVTRRTF
jgi:hypothetical protein